MGTITDPEQATAVAASVCDALTPLADAEFAKFDDLALLALAPSLERVTRLTFMAQVRLTGEIDGRRLAGAHGCPNTATLLRNTLQISAQDAATRVSTARAVLPQPQLFGGFTPPVLPRLADALTAGTIGVDQARTIVQTMNGLPTAVDPDTRDLVQNLLVEHGQLTEPHPFAVFARMVALTCDPDGTLDDHTPADKVELTIGARNTTTGLTNLKGKLDDLGVELLAQAIDGLAAPQPAADGTPDLRTPAVRRGQALKEMLRRYLDLGDAPRAGRRTPARYRHHRPAGPPQRCGCGHPGTRRPDQRRRGPDAGLRRPDRARRPQRPLSGPGRRGRVEVLPGPDPPGHHPAGPGLHLARLQPPRWLVRLPSHQTLGRRRAQQLRKRLPVMSVSPRGDPPRTLAGPARPRRHPRIHPTEMGRPQTSPQTQHRAPPHHHPPHLSERDGDLGGAVIRTHTGSRRRPMARPLCRLMPVNSSFVAKASGAISARLGARGSLTALPGRRARWRRR